MGNQCVISEESEDAIVPRAVKAARPPVEERNPVQSGRSLCEGMLRVTPLTPLVSPFGPFQPPFLLPLPPPHLSLSPALELHRKSSTF
jgi:hypothetical protein